MGIVEGLDIREVSRRSGLPSSTLRYYEEKGLIHSIGRKGLTRVFKPDVLDKLAIISLGQWAGFSLDEISSVFSSETQSGVDREKLSEQVENIEKTVAMLNAVADTLTHIAHCPKPNQFDCPKFQKLLKQATQLQSRGVKQNKF